MLYPVILAGGSGPRLWPLSRQLNPKQFLPLTDATSSMLQVTLQRLDGLLAMAPTLVCNDEHRFLAAEQLRESGIEDATILLEPIGRNTAPAIALAALSIIERDPDAVLLVLAADHNIANVIEFQASVNIAKEQAEKGKLVTFGIKPTSPETEYGYIRSGEQIANQVWALNSFVEKPAPEIAQKYLNDGAYSWNSGMFLFRADRYLVELKKFRPDIFNACQQAYSSATTDLTFTRIGINAFRSCPDESIDYAVMEKTNSGVVVQMDVGWSDIGTWSSLWKIGDKDEFGNVRKGDVIVQNSKSSLIFSSHRLVALVGVEDLVVIETKDAILVANKNETENVEHIVEAIKSDGRHEHMNHREVYRPWGLYDSVDNGKRYQVKRITVNPGARLSLQMHHHRAEHWIVVSGTALVTNGDKNYLVTENQSTYIPVGQVHCLENPGVIPLELIEVQSGSYLGEDDIVRLKDRYGRS